MGPLDTFIPPASALVVKTALAAGDLGAASQEFAQVMRDRVLPPGPLRVTITHEPFMPWFKLEYDGQTEELDHLQCLEWFRLRGAKDMEKVNDAINQAFNFGQGRKGAVFSQDGSVAVYEDRPGVVFVIGEPRRPQAPPGQEERYLPKL